MEGLPFVDTNVFVRYVMNDHPEHSPRARDFFERIERGEFVACTIETAIFEAVYTLLSVYRASREEVGETLTTLLQLPGLRVPGKATLIEAFELLVEHRRLSFGDCYHAAVAKRLGSPEFISFDRGFDRLPWLNRTAPA